MDINYIALAIPVFLLLIAIEALFAWREQREYYRFNDAINDLSCGIIQQVIGVFMKTILFAGYLFLFDRFALLNISERSITGWVVLFFGVDFFYYWFHRMSHEMNAPWAAHIVHHQSEEFNLAVALRQGTLQSSFSWIFYLPLAIIGFPPVMFLTMSAFNTLYQFWIHTRAIDKLGPLEWVLNTPSHHRVHHGRNPKYLDKNHAGTLIVWDRMFGTFQTEEEEVVYGVTEPLNSWNPVWANLQYWTKLWREMKMMPRFVDKIKFWLMPPGWRPKELPPLPPHPEVTPATIVKYDTTIPLGLQLYVLLHFMPTIWGVTLILNHENDWPWSRLILVAALILFTVLNMGGILDKKSWVFKFEITRLLMLAIAAGAYFVAHNLFVPITALVLALMIGSTFWLLRFQNIFSPAKISAAAFEI
ncbi:MAG: hypothetical protein ILNGONEN_01541 [Syntrophorhabdaceae bacterium]|nr:hypothetical protein [Syntrophorhabdaceae bacterium]